MKSGFHTLKYEQMSTEAEFSLRLRLGRQYSDMSSVITDFACILDLPISVKHCIIAHVFKSFNKPMYNNKLKLKKTLHTSTYVIKIDIYNSIAYCRHHQFSAH